MVYEYEHQTFIIENGKIYGGNKLQRYYLQPKEHYWRKHYNFVRALIEMGEIQTYNDLIHYCHNKIDIIPTYYQPKVPHNYGLAKINGTF